jgi:hypothetical protein
MMALLADDRQRAERSMMPPKPEASMRGMDDPAPALQRVKPSSGRGLPQAAAITVAIATIAFLVGLALGGHVTPGPSPSPSPPPAFAGAHVSRELWTAYLNSASNRGWTLCAVAATITCEPGVSAVPDRLFTSFDALPLLVSTKDWDLLSPITAPLGHYVLAGPMTLLAPEIAFARVSPAGVGTLVGPDGQTVWSGVVWADLGTLAAGRYVAVVGAYALSAGNPEAQTTALRIGWAVGFAVGTSR